MQVNPNRGKRHLGPRFNAVSGRPERSPVVTLHASSAPRLIVARAS
jgi:hypothetical protein